MSSAHDESCRSRMTTSTGRPDREPPRRHQLGRRRRPSRRTRSAPEVTRHHEIPTRYVESANRMRSACIHGTGSSTG
jgi:hypothetical protein